MKQLKHFLYVIILTPLLISWVFWAESSNILWISDNDLRTGNVDINDIPVAINSLINFFMSIAGTIAVIFVIIWAYKILFGSIQQDKTKGRDTIIMALSGFALAALAWVIVKVLLANLA